MKLGSLLLVDDDRQVLDAMADWLRDQGFEVSEAANGQDARQHILAREFDLIIADVRLQDGNGFELLAFCRERRPGLPVILVTGYATVETGVDAIRAGAFDLLTKPLIDDELLISIDRALSRCQGLEANKNANTSLNDQLDQRLGLENIVGRDHRMLRVFDVIDSVANTRATVLITGESGTGKSMIARAIHRRSSRRNAPFVEVACGALPETLLESELFGHVAGAFTGAVGAKIGKFLQADGGTIFLDEIGTASPSMQVKLLRVLQELEFEPVGGTKTLHVDARVILATNEDLTRAVAEGRFRQDLFYRVNVINVELPPLRERTSDIPRLAQHFLDDVCEEVGRKVSGFSDEALAALCRYQWPGNVRELQNVVERTVLLGKGSIIAPDDLPSHVAIGAPVSIARSLNQPLKQALGIPERQIILDALRTNHWNRNATADVLGINRTTLYKKMKRLGLHDPRYASVSVG